MSAWPAGQENVSAERQNGTIEKRAIRKCLIENYSCQGSSSYILVTWEPWPEILVAPAYDAFFLSEDLAGGRSSGRPYSKCV